MKSTKIVIGIILTSILLITGIIAGVNNRAIYLEEQVSAAKAGISVVEKRRADLIYNLVDAVQAYQKYEYEALTSITALRASIAKGNYDDAETIINAIAEDYPELKADENYRQLMNELALTENQIAQYRNNYNEQVRAYNKTVRSFPNNIILNMFGYERIDTGYTTYETSDDAPHDLFG